MFWLVFVFLVLFVSSLNNWFVLFCVCVVWFFFFEAGLSGFVVCILWSSFLFCCFVLSFVFLSFLSKIWQTQTQQNDKKKQNAEKKQIYFSVSAVVFTNSVPHFLGVGLKIKILAENPIEWWFQHILKNKKAQKHQKGWVKTWSKVGSKLGPSMFLRFFENIILPAEKRRRFLNNNKGQTEENLDKVLTQKKAIFGPNFDSTVSLSLSLSPSLFFSPSLSLSISLPHSLSLSLFSLSLSLSLFFSFLFFLSFFRSFFLFFFLSFFLSFSLSLYPSLWQALFSHWHKTLRRGVRASPVGLQATVQIWDWNSKLFWRYSSMWKEGERSSKEERRYATIYACLK